MKTKYFLLLIFIPLLMVSCGSPSEDVESYELIHLIRDMTAKLNTFRKRKDSNKLLRREVFSLNNVIIARKGCKVIIRSQEAEVGPGSIVSSLPGNRFIANKPFYVTTKENFSLLPVGFDGTKIYISLDGKNWYDIRGGKNNILFDYFYQTELDESNDSIALMYRLSFLLNKELKRAKINTDRKIVSLKKGMVFSSAVGNRINTDLTRKILYIPSGTIFKGFVNVEGNLVQSLGAKSLAHEGDMGFSVVRNIFIYLRNKVFSLSFDRENWDVSLLSFRLDQEIEVKATEENEVEFHFNWNVRYLD